MRLLLLLSMPLQLEQLFRREGRTGFRLHVGRGPRLAQTPTRQPSAHRIAAGNTCAVEPAVAAIVRPPLRDNSELEEPKWWQLANGFRTQYSAWLRPRTLAPAAIARFQDAYLTAHCPTTSVEWSKFAFFASVAQIRPFCCSNTLGLALAVRPTQDTRRVDSVPCVLLLLPVRGAMSSGVVGWLFVARGSRLREGATRGGVHNPIASYLVLLCCLCCCAASLGRAFSP
jgi:hypothetical protein